MINLFLFQSNINKHISTLYNYNDVEMWAESVSIQWIDLWFHILLMDKEVKCHSQFSSGNSYWQDCACAKSFKVNDKVNHIDHYNNNVDGKLAKFKVLQLELMVKSDFCSIMFHRKAKVWWASSFSHTFHISISNIYDNE